MDIITIVRTLISRFLVIVVLLFFVPILLITRMFPKSWRYKSALLFRVIHVFNYFILKATLLSIRYYYTEPLPKKPVIFAANHQSSLDIPLLAYLAQGHRQLWLARHELMDTWLLKWIIPVFAEVLKVDSPKKAVMSLRKAADFADDVHAHVMIFPEGQRYTDGNVHDFFNGFVWLAKRLARPVVPVRIFGIEKVYPPHTFWVRSYPVNVYVGPAFEYREDDTDETFKQRVHNWFMELKDVH